MLESWYIIDNFFYIFQFNIKFNTVMITRYQRWNHSLWVYCGWNHRSKVFGFTSLYRQQGYYQMHNQMHATPMHNIKLNREFFVSGVAINNLRKKIINNTVQKGYICLVNLSNLCLSSN